MSEIAKKQDAKQVAQSFDYIDPEDRSGSLRAPFRLEEDLREVREYVAGEAMFGSVTLPRFGVLSLLMRTTPCYVYGHEALKKNFGTTAFTDGVHIFICDDFYDKLLKDAKESKGNDSGVELLLMHELMHILFNHTRRLRSFTPDIRNIAMDLSINTKLQLGYPALNWSKTLKETGLGFKPGDTERYPSMSEETIAREVMNEKLRKKMKEDEKQQKNGQGKQDQQQQGQGQPQNGQGQGQPQNGQGQGQPQNGQGQGQPQNGQGQGQPQNGQGQGQPQSGQGQGQPQSGQGQGQPQSGQGQGQPQNGQGQGQPQSGQGQGQGQQPSQDNVFNGEGDQHIYDMKDVIKVLEENGLENVAKSLNMPKSDDVEAIEEMQRESDMRKNDAVQRAAVQMQQNPGKYPGAHIVESAAEHILGQSKGKLSWKLALREAIFGDGMRFKYNPEELGDPYFVEEIGKTLGLDLPIGQDLPFKPDETVLVLIDTSGSVANSDLAAFITEVMELKTASSGFGDGASEVVVLSADTVLRGEPVEITDQNADEYMNKGIQLHGRGGTDLADPIKQAAKLDMFKEKKIRSLVYFTDLFASIPKFKELGLPEGTSVTYVSAPSTSEGSAEQEEAFRKGVEDYAVVVPIREGIEVNLDQDARDAGMDGMVDNSPSTPKRGMR